MFSPLHRCPLPDGQASASRGSAPVTHPSPPSTERRPKLRVTEPSSVDIEAMRSELVWKEAVRHRRFGATCEVPPPAALTRGPPHPPGTWPWTGGTAGSGMGAGAPGERRREDPGAGHEPGVR